MKHYFYPLYSKDKDAKDAYYNELERIKSTNNYVEGSFRWSGDYIVTTYEKNGKKIEIWENAELGVPEEICYLDEEGE